VKAFPITNALTVLVAYPMDGHYWLEVPCEDYDALKALPHALAFEGRTYGRTGWDSDKRRAYYSTRQSVAFHA
jgi:hypothetical protein